MNWIDFGLIIFLLIFVILGLKRGFMTSLLSNFSFKINALLSFFLCRPIAFLFNKFFNLEGNIATIYYSKLTNASVDFSKNLLDVPEAELSGFVKNTINKSGLSDFTNRLTNLFTNKHDLYSILHNSNHESRTLADIISSSYANFFVTIISFIISIILIYFTVWLLTMLVEKLRTIGFVKVVDNILGIGYGLFRCLLFLIVISLIIKLLSPLSFMTNVINYINSSAIGKIIYYQINNFIDNYLNFADIFTNIFN